MGKVYIVGAGPWEEDLITLRAIKILKKADVILYDRLVNPKILSYAPSSCKLLYVGKKEGSHSLTQEEIHEYLLYYASLYDTVVRLKGGDPFIFGRGGEEALFLKKSGIPFEIVPGVSSISSLPSRFGIPLSYRGISSSFAVITGHCRENKEEIDYSSFSKIDTLVFVMPVKNRQKIAKSLIEGGRDPEDLVAFIEKGGMKEERFLVFRLKEVAKDPPPLEPPALMIVGEVVKFSLVLFSPLSTLTLEKFLKI